MRHFAVFATNLRSWPPSWLRLWTRPWSQDLGLFVGPGPLLGSIQTRPVCFFSGPSKECWHSPSIVHFLGVHASNIGHLLRSWHWPSHCPRLGSLALLLAPASFRIQCGPGPNVFISQPFPKNLHGLIVCHVILIQKRQAIGIGNAQPSWEAKEAKTFLARASQGSSSRSESATLYIQTPDQPPKGGRYSYI